MPAALLRPPSYQRRLPLGFSLENQPGGNEWNPSFLLSGGGQDPRHGRRAAPVWAHGAGSRSYTGGRLPQRKAYAKAQLAPRPARKRRRIFRRQPRSNGAQAFPGGNVPACTGKRATVSLYEAAPRQKGRPGFAIVQSDSPSALPGAGGLRRSSALKAACEGTRSCGRGQNGARDGPFKNTDQVKLRKCRPSKITEVGIIIDFCALLPS